MKLFATLTAGLLFGLAACQSTPTTAPGAVSGCCGGKTCSTDGACNKDKSKCTTAACKNKVASASPGAVSETKSGCCADKSAAASPGAVSETKKSDCATSCSDKTVPQAQALSAKPRVIAPPHAPAKPRPQAQAL